MWVGLRSVADTHPFALDVGLALVLFVMGELSMNVTADMVNDAESPVRLSRVWGWWLVGVVTLSIAGRRRWPLTSLAIGTVAYFFMAIQHVGEPVMTAIALLIALYSAGAYGRRPAANWARLAAIVLLFGEGFYYAVLRYEDYADEFGGAGQTLVQVFRFSLNVFYFASAWVLGDTMRARRLRQAELAERALELEAAHAEVADKAVLNERVRIARELHDVVAHHVSVMGVQAGAARRVLAQDPERAAAALSSVEASSREAVAELHRLLGFLRADDEPDSAGPQPTLRQLDRLIDQMSDADLVVELRVEGTARPLPPSVDLSAYRVVQEALTNTLKRAGPRARVRVTLTYERDAVEVRVTDEGRGRRFRPAAAEATTGRRSGLLGMRERVGLHGGAFEAGPRTDGGFEIRALLPTVGA